VPNRACYGEPALEAADGKAYAGKVRWADDLPLPVGGARVLAYAVDGGALVARAVTDDTGAFVLRAPATHVRLRICHRGARDAASTEHSGDLDDVDLAAQGDAPLLPRMFSEGVVAGRAVGRDGRPVAGARVEVRSQIDLSLPLAAEAITGADGRFVIGGLGWDPYSVQVRTDAGDAGAFEGQPGPDEPVVGVVTLAPAARLEVRLGGDDAATCSPGYLKRLVPEMLDFAVAPLDANATARFAPVTPGRYKLMFECDFTQREIELRAGAPQVIACEIGNTACTAVAP